MTMKSCTPLLLLVTLLILVRTGVTDAASAGDCGLLHQGCTLDVKWSQKVGNAAYAQSRCCGQFVCVPPKSFRMPAVKTLADVQNAVKGVPGTCETPDVNAW